MCTLMMKAGWSLRYSYHGNNTTFCPEETEEFMKQRRRWLLSDFANAAVVAWNLCKFLCAHVNDKNVFSLCSIRVLKQLELLHVQVMKLKSIHYPRYKGTPHLRNKKKWCDKLLFKIWLTGCGGSLIKFSTWAIALIYNWPSTVHHICTCITLFCWSYKF